MFLITFCKLSHRMIKEDKNFVARTERKNSIWVDRFSASGAMGEDDVTQNSSQYINTRRNMKYYPKAGKIDEGVVPMDGPSESSGIESLR